MDKKKKGEQTEAEILAEQQEFSKNTIINLNLLVMFLVNARQWESLDSVKDIFENILSVAYTCKSTGKKMAVDQNGVDEIAWGPDYSGSTN